MIQRLLEKKVHYTGNLDPKKYKEFRWYLDGMVTKFLADSEGGVKRHTVIEELNLTGMVDPCRCRDCRIKNLTGR